MIKGQRGTRVQRTGKDDVITFFFLLYINDLNNVSTVVELILFADDTNLFMSPATADVHNILEVPATDKIHIEHRSGLA